MKIREFCKANKKKIIIISISLVTVVIVVVGVAIYCIRKNGNIQNFMMQGGRGNFQVSEGMIAASGVTNVGVKEECFEVENLTVGLEVEEVYVSSEDTVQAGTKILKLSEESISEAREELEQLLKEADLAYRAGSIEYEQNKITALYDRDSTALDGQQAEALYNETVESLRSELERAEEALAEAREQIAEYESYVNDDSYRTYFKVDEYQAVYDENLRVLVDRMDEWGVSWPEVTGSGSMSGGARDMSTSVSGGDAQSDYSEYVKVLSNLYSILEQNYKDLEQAENDYNDAVANAALELQTLELNLPGLEQAVIEAQENYDTQLLQAKLTYETSLSNAEHAESDYETELQKVESDYETLKSDWEDAKENLELFESSVGDGYFYASADGSILRVMARKGQEVTSESILFMYSNPEEMTVTVSVEQGDIAQIALGDSAYIQSNEYGSFQGEVTALNPVSGSDSRTSVTYSVTVTLTGDAGALPVNTSVTVIFGMEEGAELPGAEGMPEGMGERPNMDNRQEFTGEDKAQ